MKRPGRLGGRTLGLALALMALTAAVPMIVIALLTSGGSEPEPPPDAPTLAAAQAAAAFPIYWAGESVAGLPLTRVARDGGRITVQYGDCTPSAGEGGCAPPIQIQTTSICEQNPLVVDLRPASSSRVRGVPVRDYGDFVSLEVGTSNVALFTRPEHEAQVIAALRTALDVPPVPGRELTAPRYPRAYVLVLRLVRDTYARVGTLRGVRDRLGISRSAVRQRLAFARELGTQRLRRPAGRFVREAGCPIEPPD